MSQKPPKPLISGVNPVGAFFAALLVRALASLSDKGRARLGRWLGRVAFALGIRREVTLDNLRHAFPEKPEQERRLIARGAYESMALAMVESIANVKRSREEIEAAVEVADWGPLKADLDAGRGVLIATAHFGNWELFGEAMTLRGLKIAVVVKPLKGALNARLVEARQRAGVRLILARGAVKGAIQAVNDGCVTAMLIDQVISEKHGVFVPFFGRPASTTPALSVAAQRTGAPVYVVMAAREGEKLRMYVEGPFPVPNSGDRDKDVADHTAQVTAVIEKYIRRYPDQWLWLHRRWKVQPQLKG